MFPKAGQSTLPMTYNASLQESRRRKRPPILHLAFLVIAVSAIAFINHHLNTLGFSKDSKPSNRVPYNAAHILSLCAEFTRKPGPPSDFHSRQESDRFVLGTAPVLIHNATIWTGLVEGEVNAEIVRGDVLLDKGVVKWVGGQLVKEAQRLHGSALKIIDVNGSWVTPGLVDLHAHMGVQSSPQLQGANDGNSLHGITQPWLRSLDAMNTHDESYRLSVAGGVTSANILPGSADAIGGQAFPFKLRPTTERSASAMLIEPLGSTNSTGWRQINLDTPWVKIPVEYIRELAHFPSIYGRYNQARILVEKQDAYCAAATSGSWDGLGDFPEDLKYEALGDVIRGKVKVHTHCYEAVDFDAVVRLSNEFKFPIAAFHHAHEAYLVPDLIKKAWGKQPALALFASFARYKKEAYRHSEFAPRILADNGLRVVMKSDHPMPLNSRGLLYEAQQAYFYGLPGDLALSSVTSTPANVLGLAHRIGYLKEGYDADLVVWDSHPLALGATPKQVYIDGIPQFEDPFFQDKTASFQELPKVPNFDKEAAEAVKYEGLPPLLPEENASKERREDIVVFNNVRNIMLRSQPRKTFIHDHIGESSAGVVVVKNGHIACTVDLQGGSLLPGFTTFGSPLGLSEIILEPSTADGTVFDALVDNVPSILGGEGTLARAADGVIFATRNALLAYRAGVTSAITAPTSSGPILGLATHFRTGAKNRLEDGAIVQELTSLHMTIGHAGAGSYPSISTQIGLLRRLLLGGGKGELGEYFDKIREGKLTLVIDVDSADIIATLISLKKEVEASIGHALKLTLAGGAEAHLLAKELGKAGIGVILAPVRAWPLSWEQKRILPGPPLSKYNALSALIANNVTVAIGSQPMWPWTPRNTRFELAWAALQSGLSEEQALALVTTTLEKLLGTNAALFSAENEEVDLVAYQGGGLLDFGSKVVAVVSSHRKTVDLF